MSQQSPNRCVTLVVDDDPACQRLVRETMLSLGCRVIAATSGSQALAVLEERDVDLVILDLTLGDLDGLEVCRRIRTFSLVPVIVLTGSDRESGSIRSLDAGADDYVTKPFLSGELAARARAVLRRASQAPAFPVAAPRRVRVGDLLIDDDAKCVLRGTEEIELSPTERRLLWELAANAGRVMPHHVLLERVWTVAEPASEETLRSTVRRLRLRLGDSSSSPRYIASKPGLGYVFVGTVSPA